MAAPQSPPHAWPLCAKHCADTGRGVSAPWSCPARDEGAERVGREETETAKIRGRFCTTAREHKSHSVSKKWFTVKRFWPCYLLCLTDNLTEIIYLAIYMASIRAMSEHSRTRWVFPHCTPEKEHMLLTLHHGQGIEMLKRKFIYTYIYTFFFFPGKLKSDLPKPCIMPEGSHGCHTQGWAIRL